MACKDSWLSELVELGINFGERLQWSIQVGFVIRDWPLFVRGSPGIDVIEHWFGLLLSLLSQPARAQI